MLDFANSNAVDPRVTFTRASTATYFDSIGTLQSAAINTPRLDYNPSTLAAQGLLIEEQRTNLCLQSADFGTTWTLANTTVTTNAVVSPDGTTNADNIFETAVSGEHYVRQFFTGLTANTVHTVTVFVKNLNGRNLRIRVLDTDNAANGYFMTVSPSLGTVVQAATSTGSATSASGSITAINNGWYRVTLSGNAGATCTKYTLDLFSMDGTTLSFVGDITKGVTLFGAQLEAGAFQTSYIPTTTAAVTRSADVASVNTLSPWYNATEGTIYAEVGYSQANPTAAQMAASFNDATANNRWTISFNSPSALGGALRNTGGAGLITTSTANAAIVGATNKLGLAISTGASVVLNGGTVATNASYAAPTVTRLELGSQLSGGYLNGYLRRITYYPIRLSNANLQALTS